MPNLNMTCCNGHLLRTDYWDGIFALSRDFGACDRSWLWS